MKTGYQFEIKDILKTRKPTIKGKWVVTEDLLILTTTVSVK
jgi:hypothetical protein